MTFVVFLSRLCQHHRCVVAGKRGPMTNTPPGRSDAIVLPAKAGEQVRRQALPRQQVRQQAEAAQQACISELEAEWVLSPSHLLEE